MIEITPHLTIPDSELQFTFSRSGGPGGQNVNKVNSKATLRWNVVGSPSLPDAVKARFIARYRNRLTQDGDLLVTSQRYRDQPKNIDDCLEKLAQMIREILVPPKKRRPTKPTRSSQQRRLTDKRQRQMKKEGRKKGGFGD